MKLNIGDNVKLKNPDRFASFELDAINGKKITSIMTITDQSVADDYSILVGKFFKKSKNKNIQVVKLDNGKVIPLNLLIKENKMNKLVENKLRKLIQKEIKSVLKETDDIKKEEKAHVVLTKPGIGSMGHIIEFIGWPDSIVKLTKMLGLNQENKLTKIGNCYTAHGGDRLIFFEDKRDFDEDSWNEE